MKKIYLPILLLTLAVSSCDTFDKVPSSEWPSEGAIKTLEDLQFAVNGVYESQTSSIDAGTNPRGSYAGDFFLYADQRGSDFKAIGSNKQTVDVYAYQATKNSSDSYYFYKRFYLSLARINKVLEGVKKFGDGIIEKINLRSGGVHLHIRFDGEVKCIDQKWLMRRKYT